MKIKESYAKYRKLIEYANLSYTTKKDVLEFIYKTKIDTDVHWSGISGVFCKYARGYGHYPNSKADWKLWPFIELMASDLEDVIGDEVERFEKEETKYIDRVYDYQNKNDVYWKKYMWKEVEETLDLGNYDGYSQMFEHFGQEQHFVRYDDLTIRFVSITRLPHYNYGICLLISLETKTPYLFIIHEDDGYLFLADRLPKDADLEEWEIKYLLGKMSSLVNETRRIYSPDVIEIIWNVAKNPLPHFVKWWN